MLLYRYRVYSVDQGSIWASLVAQTVKNLPAKKKKKNLPAKKKKKESACNVGHPSLVLGSRRSSGEGEGNGSPLQCTCLEDSMDRAACSSWGRKELDTTEQLE